MDAIAASRSGSWLASSTSRANSCSTSASSSCLESSSNWSTSVFTLAYSVLIFFASSWSSHRSGRATSCSSSVNLERFDSILRYPSASPRRRRSSFRSSEKSRMFSQGRRANASEPPTRREQSKRSGDQSRPSVSRAVAHLELLATTAGARRIARGLRPFVLDDRLLLDGRRGSLGGERRINLTVGGS